MHTQDSISVSPSASPSQGAPRPVLHRLLRTEETPEELLWTYLSEGKPGLPSDVKISTLAYATGIPERTLFQWRRDCLRGRLSRRFGGARDQVVSLIGRRSVIARLCGAALQAGAPSHACWSLLHPNEREFLLWLNALRTGGHGHVQRGSMEILSYDSWEGYARDLVDVEVVERLCAHLLKQPELFITSSLVERVLTNIVTSHPTVRDTALNRLVEVSRHFKQILNWNRLKPGVLSNLATCMALSDSGHSPNEAMLHVYSKISENDSAFIEAKLRRIYLDYGFKNDPKAHEKYIIRVAQNIKSGSFSFMPYGLLQAAETVKYLLGKYKEVRFTVSRQVDEIFAAMQQTKKRLLAS